MSESEYESSLDTFESVLGDLTWVSHAAGPPPSSALATTSAKPCDVAPATAASEVDRFLASLPKGFLLHEPTRSVNSVTPKMAFERTEWLEGKAARLLRIMAEFMETQDRLKKNRIYGSLMIFGSARIMTSDVWRVQHQEAQDANDTGRLSELAKIKSLTEFADKTEVLSQLLTAWFYTDEARKAFLSLFTNLPSIGSEPLSWILDRDCQPPVVVSTGGGPGIMEAATRGAAKVSGGRCMGLGIFVPHEAPNSYLSPDLAFTFHYFFTRKFWMCYFAIGVVVAPGGYGTIDEVFELLTLISTGRFSRRIPIVFLGESYWKKLINFDMLVECGTISEKDLRHLYFTDNEMSAFVYIKNFILQNNS